MIDISNLSVRRVAIFSLLFMLSLPLVIIGAEREGDINRGAQAWVNNCSRCHNIREPGEFRDDLWRPIVYHMRVRAGLTGQETRDILTFLQASN